MAGLLDDNPYAGAGMAGGAVQSPIDDAMAAAPGSGPFGMPLTLFADAFAPADQYGPQAGQTAAPGQAAAPDPTHSAVAASALARLQDWLDRMHSGGGGSANQPGGGEGGPGGGTG
jgi:hypothetical protein